MEIQQKVRFPERKHIDSQPPLFSSENTRPSLVLGEIGKVHFEPSRFPEREALPGRKAIKYEYSQEGRPEGKKYIHVERGKTEISNEQRRHFDVKEARLTEKPTNLPRLGWTRKAVVIEEATGLPASKHVSEEFHLESNMTRKQRVSNIERQRNEIAERRKGDKPYVKPDHETGFFAKGGLITGSTMTVKKSGKPVFQSTLPVKTPATTAGTMSLTFEEKQRKLREDYEKNQIRDLTLPGTRLGQDVPSWEQRTGCFLVIPEEENY